MVSTRGRQPTTTITEPEKNSSNDLGTDSRPRKRRRNISPKVDRLSPTAKRQEVPVSSPRSSSHLTAKASYRSTRQQVGTPTDAPVQPHVPAPGSSLAASEAFSSPPPQTDLPLSLSDSRNTTVGRGDYTGLPNTNYASQGYIEMGTVDTSSFLPQGAGIHVKIQSLPVLDNLVNV